MRSTNVPLMGRLVLPVEIGPFGSAAIDIRAHRLAVMPVGGDDGKRPLIGGFTNWRGPPSEKTVSDWVNRFPDANVGISCGPSRIAVIDVDDASLLERVIAACGDTSLIVRTGRGYHLYFRDEDGLSSGSLRPQGLDIDIKAVGGFVVAPPSLIPSRPAPYRFERGGWSAVRQLPRLTQDALARLVTGHTPGNNAPTSQILVSESGLIDEGARNNALFTHLRACAPFLSREDVVEEARSFNQTQTAVPMPDRRVVSTAESVWDYQQRGLVKVPGRGHVRISHQELDLLKDLGGKDFPVALALLLELRRAHGAGQAAAIPFAVSAEAMAQQNVITGVRDPKRISRARRVLQNTHLLIEVARARLLPGGVRKPALYLLGRLKQPAAVPANEEQGS